VRGLLVCTGWLRASRIPPACGLQWGCVHGMVRWFPLHRCAVSLHHRLISLLPPGAQTKTDLSDLEKLIPLIRRSPYYASLNRCWVKGMGRPSSLMRTLAG
jgi:hypothetical protein